MSFAVTPELKLDIEQLIEDRSMSAADGQRLFAAVVGDGGKARDAPFFAAAQLMYDMLVAGDSAPAKRRVEGAIALVMDINQGAARRIEAKLVSNPKRASRGRPELPASLILFLLTTDTCAYFNDMRDALLRTATCAANDTEALPELARAFGRIIYQIRQKHLPHEALGKEHLAWLRFLRLNGGFSHSTGVTDDLILRFWQDRVREGARLTYRSSVLLVLAYEQLQFDQASLTGMQDAADINASDWDDTAGATAASGLAASVTGNSLTAMVEDMPTEPKLLTRAERDRLQRVFALAPYHRSRPLTVLRFISFGDAQAVLIQQVRTSNAAFSLDKALGSAPAYEELASAYADLQTFIVSLVEIAAMLSTTAHDCAPTDAALGKKLTSFRRSGFDKPVEELRDIFDKISSELSMIGLGAESFTAAVSKLHGSLALSDRFAQDMQVFNAAFCTLFNSDTYEATRDDEFI